MNAYSVACTKCKEPLKEKVFNVSNLARCSSCGTSIRVDVFPALFKVSFAGQAGESLLVENATGCFYHPQKEAVVHCQSCGRFLCALCDIELNGKHLCPSCLETGKKKGKLKNLENERAFYDNIALAAVFLPLLIFWLTLITAPLAIYIAIRYWKAPSSILPRTKIRFVIAIAFALLQIGGWVLFFGLVVTK